MENVKKEQVLPPHIVAITAAYQSRAEKVNFKNKMPVYPSGKDGNEPSEESIRGWNSRFKNWSHELHHIERMYKLNIEASMFSDKALFNLK